MSEHHQILDATETAYGGALARRRDDALLWLLRTVLSNVNGRLAVRLPSGRTGVIGCGAGLEASLSVRNFSPLWKSISRGTLGFADAYLEGDFDTRDLRG